jgi:GT2 family glycosyltransferase
MRLAVLIPTKHRHRELARSLATVLPMARRCGAEVVICDQSPTPFAHPGLRVLHRPDLPGLPAARNALLAAIDADLALFLDDDTDPAPDLGERLLALAAAEPKFAAWGAVVEARPRPAQRLHRLLFHGSLRDARRLTAGRCDRPTRELFGCCFAVRRAAAQAIGGFDARLPGYALGEDRDFCWRLHAAGFRLRFAQPLRAIHRAVGGQRPPLRSTLLYLRWFTARHGRGDPATLAHAAIATVVWTVARWCGSKRS